MAQKTHTTLIDDLDGKPADETLSFALDGTAYEIDLTRTNAAALRDVLAIYIGAGRKATRADRGVRRRSRRTAGATTTQIREWGRTNGFVVSERGRISAELQLAYDAAH